jgi:hypothetical protein
LSLDFCCAGILFNERKARQRQPDQAISADRSFADLEIERLGGAQDRGAIAWRGKALQQQGGIKGHPMQLTQAAERPDEIGIRQGQRRRQADSPSHACLLRSRSPETDPCFSGANRMALCSLIIYLSYHFLIK